jgi:ribosomal protein S4
MKLHKILTPSSVKKIIYNSIIVDKDKTLKISAKRRVRASLTNIQYQEKRKLSLVYGNIPFRQLDKMISKSLHAHKKFNYSCLEYLIDLLESRLDVLLFRCGFAPNVYTAKKMIVHGHVNINNVLTRAPAYVLRPGDIFSVQLPIITRMLNFLNIPRPCRHSRKQSTIDNIGLRAPSSINKKNINEQNSIIPKLRSWDNLAKRNLKNTKMRSPKNKWRLLSKNKSPAVNYLNLTLWIYKVKIREQLEWRLNEVNRIIYANRMLQNPKSMDSGVVVEHALKRSMVSGRSSIMSTISSELQQKSLGDTQFRIVRNTQHPTPLNVVPAWKFRQLLREFHWIQRQLRRISKITSSSRRAN